MNIKRASLQAGRAGTKAILALLAVALLVAGCVNVHVHFPSAPGGETQGTADKTP